MNPNHSSGDAPSADMSYERGGRERTATAGQVGWTQTPAALKKTKQKKKANNLALVCNESASHQLSHLTQVGPGRCARRPKHRKGARGKRKQRVALVQNTTATLIGLY